MSEYIITASKEDIVQYYCVEKHSRQECANYFNTTLPGFASWLRQLKLSKYPNIDINEEILKQYYLIENHTLKETALYFNISEGSLSRKLQKLKLFSKTAEQKREHALRTWEQKTEEEKLLNQQRLASGRPQFELPNISKEDIYNYYIVENHSRGDCYHYFNVSSHAFVKLLEKYGIKKAPEKVAVSKKDFYDYFITQNHTWEETAKYFNISKNQAVNLGRRYDIKKPSYLFSQHVTDMNNRRWASCSEEEKEAFKQKISKTKQALPNEEKKARAARGYETRRKNGTITTSSPEETTYEQLCEIFSADDIVRQYKSKLYPFHCDFYIKSLDLYIELNLHWAHGKHLFNKYNKDDLEKLTIWQSKADTGNNYYKRAVTTWTIRDPLKFETAKKNNLNYIVLYNDTEIVNYLNILQQTISAQ